ncbi:MAG: O-antigen ligase family protein [Aeromonas sp.]
MAPIFLLWLDRLTTLLFSVTLGFTFCGLFLLPAGKTIISNLLVISSVIGLLNVVLGGKRSVGLTDRRLLWVFLGYAAFIFINRIIHGDQYGVMRALAYVVLFGLLIPRKAIILTVSRYAILLGGLGLGILSLIQVDHGIARVDGFTNAILFSQGALALAILGWFIGYEKPVMRWGKILSAITIAMSLYALYASQSRGVWLALVVILVIPFAIKLKQKPLKYLGVLVVTGLALTFCYQQSTILQTRAHESISDLKQARNGVYGTSWGLRIVAWQGAWQGFLTSPVIGVGTKFFGITKRKLVAEGISPPLLTSSALAHSHSQYMQNLFIRGAVGLCALLIFIGLPIWWGSRLAGASSVLTLYPISFAISGLSDVPFEHQILIYVYALGLLFLWLDNSLSDKSHLQLASASV